MTRLMETFEELPTEDQETVHEMSDAARDAMRAVGIAPLNDDRCAVFDEACAVYLKQSKEKPE